MGLLIFYVWGSIFFNSAKNFPENYVTSSMKADGYDVLFVYQINAWASLKMKSLGNREEQLTSGMIALGIAYPDAKKYIIRILEPTQDCFYQLDGDLYRAYQNEADSYKLTNETILNHQQIVESFLYLSKTGFCE